jgi:hypothetical protein
LTSRSISSMRARQVAAEPAPDGLGGLLGDQAKLGHGGRGMRLDLEPDAACLGRQMAAIGARV